VQVLPRNNTAQCRAQHTLAVTDIAVGAGVGAPLVATVSRDATLRLWRATSGHCAATVLLPGPARCAALAPLEDSAFVGLSDGGIACARLRRQPGGAVAGAANVPEDEVLRHHKQAVLSVAVSAEGLSLVSGVALAIAC
jgi:hypothetical protein